MKIDYYHISPIPSNFANAVNVLKTCCSLTEIGVDTRLFAADGGGEIATVFADYGITHPFDIERLGLWKLRSIGSAQFRLSALTRMRARGANVYTRDPGTALVAATAGYAVCYELHAIPRKAAQRWMIKRLLRCPSLVRIVSISHGVQDQLADLVGNLPQSRTAIIPCSADIPSDMSESREATTGIRVGYVGHLYGGKGGDLIVALAMAMPEVTFEVVGHLGDIEGLVHKLPNFISHGVVTHIRAMELLRNFDIVVAPYGERSYDAAGNLLSTAFSPLKIFEYMAYGKPIICSNLPVLREILTDRKTALLALPDDQESWRSAINELCANPLLRQSLGQAARRVAERDFSYNTRAHRIRELFESA